MLHRKRALPTLFLAFIALAALARPAGSRALSPYRILVTNDDGVRAPGILAVAQALQGLGEVTVIAPSSDQSGKGHSLTLGEPIFADAVRLPGGIEATALTATPASCVKVAVEALMKQRPDLVVSGINRGYNLGVVAYVSGTVAAAREAALMGIPAVASSLSNQTDDYGPAAQIVRQVAERVKQHGLDRGVFLCVNVPPGAANQIKGIRVTTQSRRTGDEQFEEQKTPSGRRYFWSMWREPGDDDEETDVWAASHGYAAVTPLHTTEFDHSAFEIWKKRLTQR
jgi:5'/3'-nucleotidase